MATFTSTSYKSLPGNSAVPMYVVGAGTPAFNSGKITLNGARFTIGATGSTASTSSAAPAGVFDLANKACSLKLAIGAVTAATGKSLILYVDNNTTSSANSPWGSSAAIKQDSTTLTADSTYTFSIPSTLVTTSGYLSFLQLRTETGVSVEIDSMTLTCP